jgi:hypothetical protein
VPSSEVLSLSIVDGVLTAVVTMLFGAELADVDELELGTVEVGGAELNWAASNDLVTPTTIRVDR